MKKERNVNPGIQIFSNKKPTDDEVFGDLEHGD